jgi:GT2 family glycosyltransferase
LTVGAELGVVIPHHSRIDLLSATLGVLHDRSVYVVDDSPLGLPHGALPPGVIVLRTSGEEGFARACNRGLAAVEAAGLGAALLLNDDARPLGDCIERLLRAFSEAPAVAAVGPVLVQPGGRVESAGIRIHRRSARVHQVVRVPASTTEVDALSGACLMLSSRERFDPCYHFGFEDIALCRRLRESGRRVLLVPGARCEHVGGATVPRRSRAATRHSLAGHLQLVGPRHWQRPLVIGWALAQVIREGGPPKRLLGLWEGWRDSLGF